MSGESPSAREGADYTGWLASGIVLMAVFVAAAGVWFIFHH